MEPEDLDKLYVRIQEAAVQDGGGITVLVLVAPDCDALCTCRILTDLMRADRIQYKVKPVAGYSDIAAAKTEYIDNSEELRSIVMLNCGGRVNLAHTFELGDQVRCFVLDHHRPIHLANIHAGEQICVVNDGSIVAADLPEAGSDMSEVESSEEDDDEDDFDSEEEEEEDEFSDEHEAAIVGGITADGSRQVRGKRKSPASSPEEGGRRKRMPSGRRRRERRQELKAYYLLASHGKPSSHLAYLVAQQLNKESNALLWLAIVGASAHFMSQFVNEEGYQSLVALYHDEVKQHNPQTEDQSTTVAVDNAQVRAWCDRDWRVARKYLGFGCSCYDRGSPPLAAARSSRHLYVLARFNFSCQFSL